MNFTDRKRYFLRALDRTSRLLQKWHDELKLCEPFMESMPALLDIEKRIRHLGGHVVKEVTPKRSR